MKDRSLLWKTVDSNPLWLRGVMSRYHNPTSFVMSMAPERNARLSDPEWRAIVDWIKETDFPAKILPEGILAFETENDKLVFLLRWS